MAGEMTVPDYHNQRRLPNNSTISLWEDRAIIYNEDKIESKILQPSNYKDNAAWADVLDNVTTYWFAAVTMAEYTNMLNENNETTSYQASCANRGIGNNSLWFPQRRKQFSGSLTTNR